MTAPLVRIRDLDLVAATPKGPAHILRALSLDIGRGRIVGVVGESGSGKSSLAICLLGLLPANITRFAGTIDFDGTNLVGLGPAAMTDLRGRRIAMVFQDPMTSLNPLFSIGTHLVDVLRRRDPALTRGAAKTRAEELLTTVGIPDAKLRLAAYP
ncbi:MAG: ABC transporter ATP-binding protein, partial [Alphaproteobacteria bacterium]|nr:ABC transporter ATP-binding protein [Alphaproteobacteria bacterium]